MASLLSQVDDKQAALRVMRRFGDRYPRSAFAQYYQALLAATAGDRALALTSLDRALAADPKLVQAHLLRTRLLMDQGNRAAALAGLAKAVAILPRDRNLRMNYARLLVDAGQLDKARREFATLLNQNPKDTDSIYALGVLATETRQFDLAESYFLDLIKRNVRLADTYFELGRIEEQRGNYAKANEWYSRVSGEERYLTAQLRKGIMLAKAGETVALAQHFETLRRDQPQNSITLYMAEAEALREASRYQDAFDTLERGLTLHPNDKELLYARALAAENWTGWTSWSGICAPFSPPTPRTRRPSTRWAIPWPTAPPATRRRWATSSRRWRCCPTMPPCSTAWAGCNTGWAIMPRRWNICAGPIRPIPTPKSPRIWSRCCGPAVSARRRRGPGGRRCGKIRTTLTCSSSRKHWASSHRSSAVNRHLPLRPTLLAAALAASLFGCATPYPAPPPLRTPGSPGKLF